MSCGEKESPAGFRRRREVGGILQGEDPARYYRGGPCKILQEEDSARYYREGILQDVTEEDPAIITEGGPCKICEVKCPTEHNRGRSLGI